MIEVEGHDGEQPELEPHTARLAPAPISAELHPLLSSQHRVRIRTRGATLFYIDRVTPAYAR